MAELPGGHLSPTQIETYIKCAKQYFETYIMGRKEEPDLPMVLGTVFGRVIEASCRTWAKTGKHFTTERAEEVLNLIWNGSFSGKSGRDEHRPVKYTKLGPVPEELEEFCKKWERFKLNDLEPIKVKGEVGVEVKVELMITDVPVVGYADLVERGVVTDFKVARTARFYDPSKSTQLMVYATALKIPRVGFMVFEKSTGRKVDKYVNINLPATKKYLANLVDGVARGIQHDVFPPRSDSGLCSELWCPFWNECVGSVTR
jgi:hypothetical protein